MTRAAYSNMCRSREVSAAKGQLRGHVTFRYLTCRLLCQIAVRIPEDRTRQVFGSLEPLLECAQVHPGCRHNPCCATDLLLSSKVKCAS